MAPDLAVRFRSSRLIRMLRERIGPRQIPRYRRAAPSNPGRGRPWNESSYPPSSGRGAVVNHVIRTWSIHPRRPPGRCGTVNEWGLHSTRLAPSRYLGGRAPGASGTSFSSTVPPCSSRRGGGLLAGLTLQLHRGLIDAGLVAQLVDLHRRLGLGQALLDRLAGLPGERVEVGVLRASHRLVAGGPLGRVL